MPNPWDIQYDTAPAGSVVKPWEVQYTDQPSALVSPEKSLVGNQFKAKYPQAYENPDAPQSWKEALTPDWGTPGRLLEGLATPITSVYHAAQNLNDPNRRGLILDAIDAQGNQLRQADKAFQSGDWLGGVVHRTAGYLPLVGPAAASIGETIGSGNVAGGVGQAIPLLVGASPENASALVKAGAKVLKTGAQKAGIPEALQSSAEKQYAQVLNPTTKGNKIRTAEIVPELLKRRVTAMSLKGLDANAQAAATTAAEAIDAAHESLPESASIPLSAVRNQVLTNARETFAAPTSSGSAPMSNVAETGMAHATAMADSLSSFAKPDSVTGELVIPVPIARQLRQYYDSVSQQAGRFEGAQLADQSNGAVHGIAADALRRQLNEIQTGDTTIGDLNKEYSLQKDLSRVTSDTLLRKQGQAKPLGQKIAAGAGTVAGGIFGGVKGAVAGREAISALEGVTSSPAWRTHVAVLKSRLADALAPEAAVSSQQLLLEPGAMRMPPPADASGPISSEGPLRNPGYWTPQNKTPLLGRGPIRTTPPADTSGPMPQPEMLRSPGFHVPPQAQRNPAMPPPRLLQRGGTTKMPWSADETSSGGVQDMVLMIDPITGQAYYVPRIPANGLRPPPLQSPEDRK